MLHAHARCLTAPVRIANLRQPQTTASTSLRLSCHNVVQVRDFTYEFAEAFDRHVQAHAIILKNPLVIAFAHILLRFFQPPQPYKIVKDDASATEFASTCCLSPRSFVKASYDTEAEFRLGSLLG